MRQYGEVIIKIVLCVICTIAIIIEGRVLVVDMQHRYSERTDLIVSLAKETAHTNVGIQPDIHIYTEIEYPNRDSDVVDIEEQHIQISGRVSMLQEDDADYINYSSYEGVASKLYYQRIYDSTIASKIDAAIKEYFSGNLDPLLYLLPTEMIPQSEMCDCYQQTLEEGVVPVILFPHETTVSDNIIQIYYYHMTIPTSDGYILIYAEKPFIITDKPVTTHVGSVLDNPMTSHTLNMYEAGAIDNTKLGVNGGEELDNYSSLEYPVYGNYDTENDMHNRKQLLSYASKIFDSSGVATDGTKLDTHSEVAKQAQVSVRKEDASSVYLTDNNLKIESIAFHNANDGSEYTATLTLGNTVSEPHGFVVGVYILDDARDVLGVKIFDHTSDPIPADGQVSFDIKIDSSVVEDPTKVHYLQFDLR